MVSNRLLDEFQVGSQQQMTDRSCAGTVLRWGRRQLPQTLAFPPKCDMKHWLTNSKHRHLICAKRSVVCPSEYVKMRFQLWTAARAHNAPPDPLVSWGGDIPFISNPTQFGGTAPVQVPTARKCESNDVMIQTWTGQCQHSGWVQLGHQRLG